MSVTPSSPPPGRRRRPRDSARAGVYAGENQVARLLDRSAEFPVVEVAGSRITLPPERHFGDVAGVQRYVDAVLALDWVAQRWPVGAATPVAVRERRGASKANYTFDPVTGDGTIAVPVRGRESRWALRELVVLHEIAHHLARGARSEQSGTANDAGPADADHGPGFTARLLELAGGVMGPEVALLLRVAWSDQGVPIG